MTSKLLVNWKTTSSGLVLIIGSVIHLIFAVRAGTASETTWTISLLPIIGGLGLIFAGDGNKSASIADLEKVKQAIIEVPTAIRTGDVRLLTPVVEAIKPEPVIPIVTKKTTGTITLFPK